MKDLDHIEKFKVNITNIKGDENNAIYAIPHPKGQGLYLVIIASIAEGWEHVSVVVHRKVGKNATKPLKRCPTWEEMMLVKDLFWSLDEMCVQYHPTRADYINDHNGCLHIWKPVSEVIPKPPRQLVGKNLKYSPLVKA